MKTIIVTGGAGFIGSNFIFHMLDKYPDYRIICLDKLTYAGNLSTLKSVMGESGETPPPADAGTSPIRGGEGEVSSHGSPIRGAGTPSGVTEGFGSPIVSGLKIFRSSAVSGHAHQILRCQVT